MTLFDHLLHRKYMATSDYLCNSRNSVKLTISISDEIVKVLHKVIGAFCIMQISRIEWPGLHLHFQGSSVSPV